ncbi:MAG: FliG C-terminal domain-containing protein [Pseudomonadota bacterium]|nr:FliG C-terminal domain-containing protein [Pseudomonadota bacterium]
MAHRPIIQPANSGKSPRTKMNEVPKREPMEIALSKVDDDTFKLALDDHELSISTVDLRRLYQRLTSIVAPETLEETEKRQREFLARLMHVEDSGIQALLRSASHDDILVLLHFSEQEEKLRDRLYSNMGVNSVKMYKEDLLFQYSDGVPNHISEKAINRLINTAENLARDGALNF